MEGIDRTRKAAELIADALDSYVERIAEIMDDLGECWQKTNDEQLKKDLSIIIMDLDDLKLAIFNCLRYVQEIFLFDE